MPACLMQEARQLFSVVCAKLDALAHSSLAAKPVVTDLEIKVNAPAVTMEDAAPVTMSAAGMQAPEEVHAKVRAHRAAKRLCLGNAAASQSPSARGLALGARASHVVSDAGHSAADKQCSVSGLAALATAMQPCILIINSSC